MIQTESPGSADFGVVIACCDQDLLFAKGCCASIRYFCGDVPICLIVDGNISVASLKRTYGVTALYAKDISDIRLRRQSFGFGLTKMVALWFSPFRRFLFLDSDTVMWGNLVAALADFKDAVIDQHFGGHTDDDIENFFFLIEQFEQKFPKINWRRHKDEYFCAGVFAIRRNALAIESYLAWLDVMSLNPSLIKPGDQTPFNLMIFQAADDGQIKLEIKNIQLVTHGVGEERLRARFLFKNEEPDFSGEPVAIHWAGAKPLLGSRTIYSKPMTFFRRKFLKDSSNISGFRADLILRIEDSLHRILVTKNRIRRLIKNKIIHKWPGFDG